MHEHFGEGHGRWLGAERLPDCDGHGIVRQPEDEPFQVVRVFDRAVDREFGKMKWQ